MAIEVCAHGGQTQRNRCRARLAGAVALAGSLALLAAPTTAPAQSVITLVSNTPTTSSNHWFWAQSFTTGSSGATVSEIQIFLDQSVGDVSVRLRSDNSGVPGSLLATFTNPSSLPSGLVTATFTAPANTVLAANTTYWISGNEGVSTRRGVRSASGPAETGEPGWTIANGSLQRPSDSDSWSNVSSPRAFVLRGTLDTPSGGTLQALRKPKPLQLALWTDRPGYRTGETVRLYRSVDPHDDRDRYRTFVYLEGAGGGRRYLAPVSAKGKLGDEAVDARGLPESALVPRRQAAADKELIWQGTLDPGLYRFVMELRPGVAREQVGGLDEPLGSRRAVAHFVVAERSRLFNRSGFDREIRDDLTLRNDTLYYLGHQLFVHSGVTLTFEPGTVLQAYGRHAAIIVEPGGRIIAEGTREAPVLMTCSAPVGWRQAGCWGGLLLLGRAPSTRPSAVAPGVLPTERAAYGGTDEEDSSGILRYVRVEFAGAGSEPEAAAPAIGLYGVGSGTVLDHVQARASLGDGFAFHGGAAVCEHCVASGSGNAGLVWNRGWHGGASHLYVQHGPRGLHALDGGNDEDGPDREPRSLPTLSNVTLVHSWPYGRRARKAAGVLLRSGTGLRSRDLLVTGFGGGAINAGNRTALLFEDGESSVSDALLYLNGPGRRQVRGGLNVGIEFVDLDPKLRDVRWFANPDPRLKASSPALEDDREGYIEAFDREVNWLQEWTVFGPESVYDLRQRPDEEN